MKAYITCKVCLHEIRLFGVLILLLSLGFIGGRGEYKRRNCWRGFQPRFIRTRSVGALFKRALTLLERWKTEIVPSYIVGAMENRDCSVLHCWSGFQPRLFDAGAVQNRFKQGCALKKRAYECIVVGTRRVPFLHSPRNP